MGVWQLFGHDGKGPILLNGVGRLKKGSETKRTRNDTGMIEMMVKEEWFIPGGRLRVVIKLVLVVLFAFHFQSNKETKKQ